jgi:hypothetical protein
MYRFVSTALILASSATAMARAGFRPGESFTFRFSVGAVESGRARMSVGQPSGSRVAIHGQAETSPWLKLFAPLEDDYQLVLDTRTLSPVRITSVERGLRDRRIAVELDGRRADLLLHDKNGAQRARRLMPSAVRDPLGMLFFVRAQELADGQVIVQDVLDGVTLWRWQLTVKRGEQVKLEMEGSTAKPRPAIRVDATVTRIDDSGRPTGRPQRGAAAWFSDDDARLLYRIEAETDLGKCRVELAGYNPHPT